MRFFRTALSLVLLMPGVAAAQTTASVAATAASKPDPELEQMRDLVTKRVPEVHRDGVQRLGNTGLYEVHAGSKLGYVTADGRYLMSGDLIDLGTGEPISEHRRNQERLNTVVALDPGAIEFSPEAPTRWITVFTDIDCEYCRLLHHEVPKLNQLGVGVRYLFFSKFGAPSKAFDKAKLVWCQSDRRAALNVGLLTGVLPSRAASCDSPVLDQYQAAVTLGIRGTPAVVMPDGSLFYGYAKGEKIVEEMDARAAADAKYAVPAAGP